jgi:hypothetical protein
VAVWIDFSSEKRGTKKFQLQSLRAHIQQLESFCLLSVEWLPFWKKERAGVAGSVAWCVFFVVKKSQQETSREIHFIWQNVHIALPPLSFVSGWHSLKSSWCLRVKIWKLWGWIMSCVWLNCIRIIQKGRAFEVERFCTQVPDCKKSKRFSV